MNSPQFPALENLTVQIASHIAEKFWNADKNSIHSVSAGYTVVFKFTKHNEFFYLKLTHSSIHSYKHQVEMMNWVQYLFTHGAQIPQPIPSNNNTFAENVRVGKRKYIAMVYKKASGEDLEKIKKDKRIYHAWGVSLAKFHEASRSYQCEKPQLFHFLSGWMREIKSCIHSNDHAAKQEYEMLRCWYKKLPKPAANQYGLTHADARPGNALWDGAKVTIIDFDEPMYGWFVQDIARSLSELWGAEQAIKDFAMKHFLAGYTSVRNLTDFEIEAIPWFMRVKMLEMYAWHPTGPMDPAMRVITNSKTGDNLAQFFSTEISW